MNGHNVIVGATWILIWWAVVILLVVAVSHPS